MKVCVDAGHGGEDPGAVGTSPFRLEEKEFNLKLAMLLEEQLEALGHWVVMTRRKDRYLKLISRANFANRLNADLFMSIHANSAATPEVSGMEVFHFPGSEKGEKFAAKILKSMLKEFPGHKRRGVKEANFTVLRTTKMPAVLVESEFLSNPQQLKFLADSENQEALASAIARGIDQTV
jgi:N-acetylmuramoyl-L-alanine amidase